MLCLLLQKKKKDKKPKLLPLTKDIEKLRKFLLYELSKMLKFCQESTKDGKLFKSRAIFLPSETGSN